MRDARQTPPFGIACRRTNVVSCLASRITRYASRFPERQAGMADVAIEPQAEVREPRDWEGRLELITAILLGLAAVATAWAAFQGSQYDGQMLTAFTDANLHLSDANQAYNE